MWLRLRQICLVAADIESVVADLNAIFGIEVCHIDPAVGKYGLENRLLPIGNQLLEIVSPTRPGTAAGRYLERRGGDGGYMVITQCDALAPRAAHVEQLGVRVANALDHDGFHGMQLHPKDTGGAFFEIDEQRGNQNEDGDWHPAGNQWQAARRTEVIDAIVAAELQSDDPSSLAAKWSEIAQIPLNPGPPLSFALDNAIVRFVPPSDGRAEGLGQIDVRVRDRTKAITAARARGCFADENTLLIGGIRIGLVNPE
ncbi:MAG: hypothetical protein K0U93_23710 [Gammaproteobacteria bacterium]|nr:hypothetical protein [Gammaproteobacteria bacterium]